MSVPYVVTERERREQGREGVRERKREKGERGKRKRDRERTRTHHPSIIR